MDGITIISKHVFMQTTLSNVIISNVLILVAVVAEIFLCRRMFKLETKVGHKIFAVLVPLSCVVMLGFNLYDRITELNTIDHVEYIVEISDEVTLSEFAEAYELLGRDGDYYIIQQVAKE